MRSARRVCRMKDPFDLNRRLHRLMKVRRIHDLPLGKVRTRMNGSSGGHRGVASVLEAFQTDQFRRGKIGVKRQSSTASEASTVLTRFDTSTVAVVTQSLAEANQQLLALSRKA